MSKHSNDWRAAQPTYILLLIAARDQFLDDPDRSEVNWKALQEQLGITRYRCDALRKELDSLRAQVINAKGKPFFSTK